MKRPGTRTSHSSETGRHSAFTLAELLVVLCALALLTFTLVPTLARAKGDSRAFQCLNNNRELNRAWRMWSDDNQDRSLAARESADPSALAWVTGVLDYNPGNSSNWDPSVDIMKSPMWLYCGTNLGLWKCPADQSFLILNGARTPRVRSFAMNIYCGVSNSFTLSYYSFKKFAEINALSPSQLFVFLDVREDSIRFGDFATDMSGYSPRNPAQYRLQDVPGAYHEGGATFSFADGHGELHRWQDRRTTPPALPSGQFPYMILTPRNEDVAWLQDRATRPK